MSDRKKNLEYDYSRFDAIPTDVLENILRVDAQLSESEPSDSDAILYIMEVLARREIEENSDLVPDVEAALNTFNKVYRPTTGDEKSLHADCVGDDTDKKENTIHIANSSREPDDIQDPPEKSAFLTIRKISRKGYRLGLVAIIAAIVLLVGTVTASALGFDLWSRLATWTGEVFGFNDSQVHEVVVEQQLQALYYTMKESGVNETVLPSYLPDGYELVYSQRWPNEDIVQFDCMLSDGVNTIVLRYSLHQFDYVESEFEKDFDNPEIYQAGGISHYIMTNAENCFVVWQNNNIECYILGVSSRDELIKIINSIYGVSN